MDNLIDYEDAESRQFIPISKKCRLCKTVKLLNEFEIDEKKDIP